MSFSIVGSYFEAAEAMMNSVVRENPSHFRSQDIAKVLLKELLSLYGILGTQEFSCFFNVRAFNTEDEVGLEALSRHSNDAPSEQQ